MNYNRILQKVTTRDGVHYLPVDDLFDYVDELYNVIEKRTFAEVFLYGYICTFHTYDLHWVSIRSRYNVSDNQFIVPFKQCVACHGWGLYTNNRELCESCHTLLGSYINDISRFNGPSLRQVAICHHKDSGIIGTFHYILDASAKRTSMYSDAVYIYWLITLVCQPTLAEPLVCQPTLAGSLTSQHTLAGSLVVDVIYMIAIEALSGIDAKWVDGGNRYSSIDEMYDVIPDNMGTLSTLYIMGQFRSLRT